MENNKQIISVRSACPVKFLPRQTGALILFYWGTIVKRMAHFTGVTRASLGAGGEKKGILYA